MENPSNPTKPATPEEAEALARQAISDYLEACRVADVQSMGNYLMKLCSVAGCLMAGAEGSEMAWERLVGTAEFVLDLKVLKKGRH